MSKEVKGEKKHTNTKKTSSVKKTAGAKKGTGVKKTAETKKVVQEKKAVKTVIEEKNVKSKIQKKCLKIGKLEIKISSIVIVIVVICAVLAYFISPKYYSITTALYNQGTEEDKKNVENAMGSENTEERFRIYFQWYNILHELGHGLLYYNDGVNINVAYEEQLVNDFAVAYWKYYGEEDKVSELEDIARYAVEHIGTNYSDGIDYLKLGKEQSLGKSFNPAFFNFNDYGWFQFSSVKHSFETNKDLQMVLREMGFKNFKLNEKKTLVYGKIDEDVSTRILNDAVKNVNEWGLKCPDVIHHFDKNPNNNYSRASKKYLGIFEIVDFGQLSSTFTYSHHDDN